MSTIEPNFLDQLDEVARRARRLQWIYGICGFLFVLLAAIVLTSLLDYGFSIRDATVRGVLSLCVVALSVWACIKFVRPAWRYQPSRLEVALRVEKFFPTLGNKLSSAVAFLENEEQGNTAMDRLAIERAAAQVRSLTVQDALNGKPASRMFSWLIGGLVMLGALAITAPVASRIALSRLAFPNAGPEWPRRHNLAWANAPEKIAEGQDVRFELGDQFGRKLPDKVWFQWKRTLSTGAVEAETREMTLAADNRVQTTFTNVLASIEYRAYGGDDDSMPWRKLQVVPAATIVETKITVHAPAYTGFRVYHTDQSSVTAMVGSHLELELALSRPIQKATIAVPSRMFELETLVPGRVDRKGKRVRFELNEPLVGSGTLTAVLTDRDGVSIPASVAKVVAMTDQAPAVDLEWGVMRRVITPDARIPLHLKVRDDLAVQQIDITIQRPNPTAMDDSKAEPTELPSERAAGPVGGLELVPNSAPKSDTKSDTKSRNRDEDSTDRDSTDRDSTGGDDIEHERAKPVVDLVNGDGDIVTTRVPIWQGSPETAARDWVLPVPLSVETAVWTLDGKDMQLSVGDTVTLVVTATDYLGSSTDSEPQRWTVVSTQDLASILRGQQDQALHYLEEAADRQSAADDRVQGVKTGTLAADRAMDLAGVDSRNAEQTLAQRVLPLLTDALQTRRFNDIPKDDADSRLETAIKQLSGIVYTDYPELLDDLDKWNRATSGQKPRHLDAAADGTNAVSQKLSDLVDSLSVWNRRENAGEGGAELLGAQQQLRDDTEQFHLENLASGNDGDQRQRDDLAGRQAALAERFDRWLNEVEDLAKSDPELFGKIVEEAFASGISSQMRETVDELRDGELGRASRQQSELVEALSGLTGQLSEAGANRVDELADELADEQAIVVIAEQLTAQLQLNQKTAQVHRGQILPGQGADPQNLATDQADIAANLQALAETLSRHRDSLFAISALARETSDRLGVGDAGVQTQADQKTIAKSLAAFVTSTQPEEDAGGDKDGAAAGGEQPEEKDGPTIKDWQVVQEWQESVLRQTESLAKLPGDQASQSQVKEQAKTLSQRQDQLADLVRKLIADSDEDGTESDPNAEAEVKEQKATTNDDVEREQENATTNDPANRPPSSATTDELLNDLLDLPLNGTKKEQAKKEQRTDQPSDGQNPAAVDNGTSKPDGGAGEDIGGESARGLPDRMQDSSRRLEQGDVGDATQAIQRRILEQISRQVQQAQQRQEQRVREQTGGTTSQEGNGGGTGGDGDGQGNSGDNDSPKPDNVTIDERTWAQLPARVRAHLRNSPIERFLPRYELRIEQYYQRLSEEGADGG